MSGDAGLTHNNQYNQELMLQHQMNKGQFGGQLNYN